MPADPFDHPPNDESREEQLDRLAESYIEQLRGGGQPSISEYARTHPDLADEIRDTFAMLERVEQVELGESGVVNGGSVPHKELGDYRILREVGRGGMGIVYEAEQKSLGRRVALKVLPDRALLDPRQLTRFRREARAAARLQHTNIAPVFGVGEHEGTHYFAMQFIPGQGLDEVVAELQRLRSQDEGSQVATRPHSPMGSIADGLVSGAFAGKASGEDGDASALSNDRSENGGSGRGNSSEDRREGDVSSNGSSNSSAVMPSGSTASGRSGRYPLYMSIARIGLQAGEALDYAHGQGVLHRDVKPSNLILDIHANVWVTDFGLAKDDDADDLTNSGDLVGTLRYMAPERFRGWCDPRSDVYGLGLTLYELLTLEPAFSTLDRGLLIKQVTQDDPTAPHRIDRQIPRDLETIVLKSIAKEAGQRYQSAGELADDLRLFLEGKPIQARRTPLREQVWLWCRRNPLLASLSSSLLLLLLVGVIATSWAALHFQRVAHEKQQLLTEIEVAKTEALQRLYDSNLTKATAYHASRQMGQRFDSLDGLGEAARLARELGKDSREILRLRNAVINTLALVDASSVRTWEAGFPTAFSHDLSCYAVTNEQGEILVRRVADDREQLRLGSGKEKTRWMRFSPDGAKLVACYRSYYEIWDIATAIRLRRTESLPGLRGFDFRADGTGFAYLTASGEIRLENFEESGPSTSFSTISKPHELRFSPDGKQVAVAIQLPEGRAEVQVWDLKTEEIWKRCTYSGQVGSVYAMAWRPDGRVLATSNAKQDQIVLWDVPSGNPVRVLRQLANRVVELCFSPDGRFLFSYAWGGDTQVWETATGKELLQLDGKLQQISADGNSLALLTSSSLASGKVVSFARPEEFRVLPASKLHRLVAGEHLLARTQSRGVSLYDPTTLQRVGELPVGATRQMKFLPKCSSLVSFGSAGLLRWPMTLDELAPMKIGPPIVVSPPRRDATFFDVSQDGRVAVTVHPKGQYVRVFQADRADHTTMARLPDVTHAAASSDGRWLVLSTQHGKGMHVWDVSKQRLAKNLWPKCGAALAYFSPDGKWLVGSSDDVYRVWDVDGKDRDAWRLVRQITRPDGNGRHGRAAFNGDGGLMAVALGRNQIRLMKPGAWTELATLPTQLSDNECGPLTISADGRFLCAWHKDVNEVWDLHAIRRRLSAMGLDWSDRPIPLPKEQPLRVEVVSK